MNVFNLFLMFKIALKHWVALVLAAIVSAGVVFAYFNFIAVPKYSASGAVMVTNGTILADGTFVQDDTKLQNSDIVASINFVDTVVDILETSEIYENLSEELGGKYTMENLKGRTQISRRDDNSLFIDVKFTSTSPKETVVILNKFLDIIPDYIGKEIKNTSVLVDPSYTATEVYMNNAMLICLSAVGGAAIVYLIIFLIYSSDTVIRDEETFKDHIDIPVIGVVPDFANSKSIEKKYYRYNRNYYANGGY